MVLALALALTLALALEPPTGMGNTWRPTRQPRMLCLRQPFCRVDVAETRDPALDPGVLIQLYPKVEVFQVRR